MGTARQILSIVGVGGFEHGVHTAFEGGLDIFIDTVSDEEDILGRLPDSLGGYSEDSQVWFSKIELVRVQADRKKIQYPNLFEVMFERATVYESIGDDSEFQAEVFQQFQSLFYIRLNICDSAQRFIPQPCKMPPLLPVEFDSSFCSYPAQ